jgi:hypothetical protein
MAQPVNRQPLTAGIRVRFQVYVRYVVVKVAMRRVFAQVFLFSPASITPPMFHTSSTNCFHQKDKRVKSGNLQKSNAVSEISEGGLKNALLLVLTTPLIVRNFSSTPTNRNSDM